MSQIEISVREFQTFKPYNFVTFPVDLMLTSHKLLM